MDDSTVKESGNSSGAGDANGGDGDGRGGPSVISRPQPPAASQTPITTLAMPGRQPEIKLPCSHLKVNAIRRLAELYLGAQWDVDGDGTASSAPVAAGLSYDDLRGILVGNSQFTKYQLSEDQIASRDWERISDKSLGNVQLCFNTPRAPETEIPWKRENFLALIEVARRYSLPVNWADGVNIVTKLAAYNGLHNLADIKAKQTDVPMGNVDMVRE